MYYLYPTWDPGGIMKHRIIIVLMITLSSIMLSACEGATSGSVRNSSQTCHNLGGFGDCEGRIGRLSGTYSIDVEDEGISTGDEVVIQLTISVEEGSLQVSMLGPDGATTSAVVDPGVPANMTGSVQGDFDGFEIVFQAVGESSVGIDYSLRYFIE
jgi:hypothetical protein